MRFKSISAVKRSSMSKEAIEQAISKYEAISNRDTSVLANRKPDTQVAAQLPVAIDESKTFTTPVRVSFHSIRQFACDSDAVWIKAALDGIIKAGVLPDDSKEWIPERPQCTEEIGKEEKTIITIEEV